jgi:hypothetical protein
LYFARHIAIGVCERKLFMEIEEEAFDYGEPSQEEITHKHPMLPFIAITQTRYLDAELGDERFEDWQFLIWGPDLIVAYDNVAYKRLNKTEQEMIDDLAKRAEEHLLNDGGPFLVLRAYFETGEYRKEIDAVMRKHGQNPCWRRAEAHIARLLHLERQVIKIHYLLRGIRPHFKRVF